LDYFPNLQHFIAYWQTNLIYLALITERIPVIPFFPPSHIADGDYSYGPTINFGEVFDVPRLQREIGIPILEFHQVKVGSIFLYDLFYNWLFAGSSQRVAG
jgi:hypothetical protein